MRPIHLVAVGAFGAAVADRLAAAAGVADLAVTRPDAGGHVWPAQWPLARLHILATWRPAPAIAGVMDEAAFAWRLPWLPIVCEHPYLRIGPVVVPGASSCYTCHRQRLLQHSGTADLTDALHRHYDANPAAGPQGYLDSFVTLAAMTAQEISTRLATDPTAEAGQVRQVHLLTLRTVQRRAMGIHGCPRCGSGRDERNRSFAQLEADLNQVLPQAQE